MDSYGLYVVRKQEPDLVPPPSLFPPAPKRFGTIIALCQELRAIKYFLYSCLE